jgi:hypothetical protein
VGSTKLAQMQTVAEVAEVAEEVAVAIEWFLDIR